MRRVFVLLACAACSSIEPEVGPLRAAAADAGVPADASSAEGGAAADAAPAPQTFEVLVAPEGEHVFRPAALTIRVGDSVRWTWQQSGHTVTSEDGTFCSPFDQSCASAPTSDSGATYTHTFTAAGSFPYVCRPHRETMKGVIRVE